MAKEKYGDEYVTNLFKGVQANISKQSLEVAREATKEAVRSFKGQGFDDEEIVALLLGAMEETPNYNPAMNRFFTLQVRRAIAAVAREEGGPGGKNSGKSN